MAPAKGRPRVRTEPFRASVQKLNPSFALIAIWGWWTRATPAAVRQENIAVPTPNAADVI